MKGYDYFVIFIVAVKVLYVSLAVYLFYLKAKDGSREMETITKVSYWKERVELVFIVNMSILLVYLFYPWREKPLLIDRDARNLLFAYGIVILFAAKWWTIFRGGFGFGFKGRSRPVHETDLIRRHMEIDHTIKVSENIRNAQDYPNMQNYAKNNAEYQKYYTLIYPPDTIGYPGPVEVSHAASNLIPSRSSL
jgi:hypothetical protein